MKTSLPRAFLAAMLCSFAVGASAAPDSGDRYRVTTKMQMAGMSMPGKPVEVCTAHANPVSQQAIPAMEAKGAGAIVITGATASRRGMPRTTAFAPAKAAQRSLAEAMAKHLGPQGIHVAIVIIDGVVDLERTRKAMPEKGDDFFIKPDDVAETAWWLTRQPRSAWSFEVEARPFGEKW